jgi:Mg2+-importing ATPase
VATSSTRQLTEAAACDPDALLAGMGCSRTGLREEEAEQRLEQYGPNAVGREKEQGWAGRLYLAVRNPLVVLLTVLASLSFAAQDFRAGTVMLLMVALGVSLRLVQETRANTAAAQLKAMIRVTATVVRNGQAREIPLQELVPGDIVKLSAGDMIPADVRLI